MGGDGNDMLRGRGGYDLIDGDAYLNVRIGINIDGTSIIRPNRSTPTRGRRPVCRAGLCHGRQQSATARSTSPPARRSAAVRCSSLLLDRTINPGQMSIVREIKYDATDVTGDVAEHRYRGVPRHARRI